MRRIFGRFLLVVPAVCMLFVPLSAQADTLSVSVMITIKATVLPARAIVVNDQGQMVKIFSNTDENVQPKVYQNTDPGPELPLTPALQKQYDQVMGQTKQKVGVEIPVPLPHSNSVTSVSFHNLLFRSISSALNPGRWL